MTYIGAGTTRRTTLLWWAEALPVCSRRSIWRTRACRCWWCERQPSIGGHMIALSKVFPTLDCASCITTPKMSAAAHHPNIEILTNTEVEAIRL